MKKAFTILELVFAIIVIGILAATIIPTTKSTKLSEAANQIASHIRYTQHLAMIDDKFDSGDAIWYKKRWTIVFNSDGYSNNEEAYTIFSDTSATGNPDYSEVAVDPQSNDKVLSGGFSSFNPQLDITDRNAFRGMKELNIGSYYGISEVDFSDECSFSGSERISFDHMGRPLKGKMSTYNHSYESSKMMKDTCTIKLTNPEGEVWIDIENETGYVRVRYS